MTLRTPPSWLQNGSHTAENDRLSMQSIYATTGIVGTTSLAATQNGTPNMTVNLASGWAAVVGTTQANMGVYVGYNDAPLSAAISVSPVANSRIDLVCLTVNDAFYTGVLNNLVLNVVAGVVAASPVVPATPANSIALAQVLVGTAVSSIVTANITDVRVNATTNLPVATLTGVQTLTNKTLSLPIITENIKRAFAATVTAAATTTLTVNSAEQQQFTGTTTQTVALPVVSTLTLGMSYTIINDSTGVVTVQSSGANTILAMGVNTRVTFTCVLVSGTTAASWSSPAVVAGGGMTLLSTTAITNVASISIVSIDQTYNELVIVVDNAATSVAGAAINLQFNSNVTAGQYAFASTIDATGNQSNNAATFVSIINSAGTTANVNNAESTIRIMRYTSTVRKVFSYFSAYINNAASAQGLTKGVGSFLGSAAITSVQISVDSGTFTAQGNIYIYGVK
jgi:hypothetical protein